LQQGVGPISNVPASGENFGSCLTVGNFGRGAKEDLAVGVPGENFGSIADTGMVQVFYGSGGLLSGARNEEWTQDELEGAPERTDRFGEGLRRKL
jgi:hypothetical protein